MMPMNLKDYVKVYQMFDDKFCKKIITQINKTEWKKHSYFDYSKNTQTSYDDDLFVSNGTNKKNEITRDIVKLNEMIWHVLKRYVAEDINLSWFTAWHGYSLARFNRYDKKCTMRVHCDHIHSLFDGERKGIPTLTILGSLNNNYSGGEFIMWESEEIELKAGQIAVFPSNFLYPHKINPVTKGTRYSFVSWAW